jgi:hypothetical protein
MLMICTAQWWDIDRLALPHTPLTRSDHSPSDFGRLVTQRESVRFIPARSLVGSLHRAACAPEHPAHVPFASDCRYQGNIPRRLKEASKYGGSTGSF